MKACILCAKAIRAGYAANGNRLPESEWKSTSIGFMLLAGENAELACGKKNRLAGTRVNRLRPVVLQRAAIVVAC